MGIDRMFGFGICMYQRCRFTVAEQQCYAEAAPSGAERLKNLEGKKEETKQKRGKKKKEKDQKK